MLRISLNNKKFDKTCLKRVTDTEVDGKILELAAIGSVEGNPVMPVLHNNFIIGINGVDSWIVNLNAHIESEGKESKIHSNSSPRS